jgi:hypothetical protein
MSNFTAKTLVIALALSAATAGSVSAQAVTPSAQQLAALAGVPAGVYTTEELTRLLQAESDNDREMMTFILSHANRATPGAIGTTSDGKTQMATALGVNPAEYTQAELTRMSEALSDNDPQTYNFFLSHQNRAIAGPVGTTSGVKEVIAAQLGVNPADFTLTELNAMLED